MNPARTLGPAIVAGGFAEWWVYAIAPVLGMVVAVGLVWILCGAPTREEARKSGG
jgi:aquaporin Z